MPSSGPETGSLSSTRIELRVVLYLIVLRTSQLRHVRQSRLASGVWLAFAFCPLPMAGLAGVRHRVLYVLTLHSASALIRRPPHYCHVPFVSFFPVFLLVSFSVAFSLPSHHLLTVSYYLEFRRTTVHTTVHSLCMLSYVEATHKHMENSAEDDDPGSSADTTLPAILHGRGLFSDPFLVFLAHDPFFARRSSVFTLASPFRSFSGDILLTSFPIDRFFCLFYFLVPLRLFSPLGLSHSRCLVSKCGCPRVADIAHARDCVFCSVLGPFSPSFWGPFGACLARWLVGSLAP